MRKFILTTIFFFSSILFAFGFPMNCDCWTYPEYIYPYGYVTVNWTYTGGGSDCYNSYVTDNMYPWSTAYVYQNGELVDVEEYDNSTFVSCQNYT
jgi:hypothetical protein